MAKSTQNATSKLCLGCIADDVTGATDLAINLVQGGMRVVQLLDVPTTDELAGLDADAVVLALKTRSLPKEEAISLCLAALAVLRSCGAQRFYFKYCSTFDSTAEGNIGPVAIALLDALNAKQTIFCPAFPRNGRTVYQGHLFVNGSLLNESGMEHHPLNPMNDANLVRVLGQQAHEPVGLLRYEDLTDDIIAKKLAALRGAGCRLVIADACDDQQLQRLAHAVVDMTLVTGGSGLARYLPAAYREANLYAASMQESRLESAEGRSLILSGSCSTATNRQVGRIREKAAAWQVDVDAVLGDAVGELSKLMEWSRNQDGNQSLLVYSTAAPESVAQVKAQHGDMRAGRAVESFLADAAAEIIRELKIAKLIVAGGETSGAVMQRLGIRSLRIGPEICAGVPWTFSQEPQLAIALKSGNFGGDSFFEDAMEMLP